MALNKTAAYDLNLFDEEPAYSSAAPKRREDEPAAQATLEDTKSIYTQNQMKLEASLSTAEIEKHATEVLGMTKASNAQKEFISLEGGDKAEVSAQKEENLFTQFIESIKNLWS